MLIQNYVLGAFALLLPLVAASSDITRFDLQGLRLGAKYDDIKHVLPCKQLPRVMHTYGDSVATYVIECNTNGTKLYVLFDNNKKIAQIDRNTKVSFVIEVGKIKQEFINKYGEPDLVAINNNEMQLCWGDCGSVRTTSDGRSYFSNGGMVINRYLKAFFGNYSDGNGVEIELCDSEAFSAAHDWAKNRDASKKKAEEEVMKREFKLGL